jgi:protein kinase-like protein
MVEAHGWSELSAGDEFGGYRIERRLGRGGMGILYLAIEPGLERRVALKLIAPEAASDEVFAKRFAEESRIAASIEHPNVVPIYAAGEEGGVPFIAMRYVSGSDLSRRIAREGRLRPAQATALIAQVGNGLDAIHAAGLVHRDVKPANVLLSGEKGEEHAYITDFGVARNVATESGLTQTGRFVGTLDYVAPEQISGAAVDARADVYALGCLLFKLLTGEVPFPRDGEAARLYAHLNDPSPAPSLYAPEVSMALDDVVIRAMSKQPDDRYPSAGDLGRAATAAVTGTAVVIPERTVATGAAATRETPTAPRASTGEALMRPTEPASTPARPAKTTAATNRIESPSERGRHRRLGPILEVFAALATIVAVGFVLGSGLLSGGGGETTTPVARQEEPRPKPKEKPQPQSLSRSELVDKADDVCAESQGRYVAIRDLESEYATDVPYAEALVRNARQRVRGLRQLTPPPALAGPYDEYIAAQKRVLDTDKQALAAARQGDVAGVEAARNSRDAEDGLREDLSRQIGFTVCSVPQN